MEKINNTEQFCQTTFKGSGINTTTSSFGLSQIIEELANILNNSASCAVLIFTFQPNLVMCSEGQLSLQTNNHHLTVFVKFNLVNFYAPPYKRFF